MDSGYVFRDANEIQKMGLFNDIFIFMEMVRSLTWHLDCV
jgi:hypothetical protein